LSDWRRSVDDALGRKPVFDQEDHEFHQGLEHGARRRRLIEIAHAADVERPRVHLVLRASRSRVQLGAAHQHFVVIPDQLDTVVITDLTPTEGLDVMATDRSPAHGLAVSGERVVEHDVSAREHRSSYRPGPHPPLPEPDVSRTSCPCLVEG
jgi:hypothetical protein